MVHDQTCHNSRMSFANVLCQCDGSWCPLRSHQGKNPTHFPVNNSNTNEYTSVSLGMVKWYYYASSALVHGYGCAGANCAIPYWRCFGHLCQPYAGICRAPQLAKGNTSSGGGGDPGPHSEYRSQPTSPETELVKVAPQYNLDLCRSEPLQCKRVGGDD